ncbi:MAG: hypothetical protein HC777_01020, partial [Hyphomonadaceae bacterium]|nr:hypothetical protein [Hyphomonadaceae bacterium]
SRRPDALALLALGSCGSQLERLDPYSDLDFFVIVKAATKAHFLADLSWLETGSELIFAHRNTIDGWKTLDGEGVLCEFAVFEPAELSAIPYENGRVVWARDGFDQSILEPRFRHTSEDRDWLRREALTILLVGLKRCLRGEESAALWCVGTEASALVCRYLKAADPCSQADGFNPWRRLEETHPEIAQKMSAIRRMSHTSTMVRTLLGLLASDGQSDTDLLAHIHAHLDLCDAR